MHSSDAAAFPTLPRMRIAVHWRSVTWRPLSHSTQHPSCLHPRSELFARVHYWRICLLSSSRPAVAFYILHFAFAAILEPCPALPCPGGSNLTESQASLVRDRVGRGRRPLGRFPSAPPFNTPALAGVPNFSSFSPPHKTSLLKHRALVRNSTEKETLLAWDLRVASAPPWTSSIRRKLPCALEEQTPTAMTRTPTARRTVVVEKMVTGPVRDCGGLCLYRKHNDLLSSQRASFLLSFANRRTAR